MKKTVLSIATAAALAAAASSVFAGSFQITEQSVVAVGRAFAGAGIVGDDLSAVWYNPAGMTLLSGTRIQAGGTFVFLDFPIEGSGENARKHGVPVPNFFYTHQINERMWFGLGFTVPFGLATEFDKNWEHADKGANAELKVFDLNPSVAWKVTDKISLGVGVSIQYAKAYFENGTSTSLLGYSFSGTGRYKGDSWSVGANIGVMWEPTETLRFGLSYRSKVNHDSDGTLKVNMTNPYLGSLTDIMGAYGYTSGGSSFDASASLSAPAMALLTGVWEATERLTLSFTLRWVDWSSFDMLTIEENDYGLFTSSAEYHYKDAYQISVGADYRINSQFTVRGGVGYEDSPARPRYRTATLPDGNHYFIALGGTWHISDKLQFDTAVQYFRGVGNTSVYDDSGSEVAKFRKIESWLFGAQFVYKFD